VEVLGVKVIGLWCQREDLHNQLKFLFRKQKNKKNGKKEQIKKRFASKIIKDNNCIKLLIS
jgi:hypothetical protein